MRIALFTTNRISYLGANGSCVHLWTLVQAALQRQHDVALWCYKYEDGGQRGGYLQDAHAQGIEELEAMGVAVHLIPSHPRKPRSLQAKAKAFGRMLLPGIRKVERAFYDDFDYLPEAKAFVDMWRPDVICAYGMSAGAVVISLPPSVLRVMSLVDLDHLAGEHKQLRRVGTKALLRGARRVARSVLLRKHPAVIIKMLEEFDVVLEHAAHHCAWLRSQGGITRARYYPVLVPDNGGAAWQAERARARERAQKPRILLIGKVTGAATLPGLQLLAHEILPELKRQMRDEPFEIHIVGGGKLAGQLSMMLEEPWVHVRGYVDDAAHEFRACDVLLVPTPIKLGFRTRIAEGFSYGCCVVAHEANALGMPELVHDVNGLLGASGEEIAAHIVRCLRDRVLREQLSRGARFTYETALNGLKIGEEIVAHLEEKQEEHRLIAPQRLQHPASV